MRGWQADTLLDDYRGTQPVHKLTALAALFRRVCGIDAALSPYSGSVHCNFQNWIMTRRRGRKERSDSTRVDWLGVVRDPVITLFHLDGDDVAMTPSDGRGG